MCGRYAQFRSIEAVRTCFGASGTPPNHPPSWNIAPTQTAPVIRRIRRPKSGTSACRWDLMPCRIKDPKGKKQPIVVPFGNGRIQAWV